MARGPATKTCARPHCGVVYRTTKGSRARFCSLACSLWAKGQNQQNRKRIAPNRASVFTKETGAPLTKGLDGIPTCTCGKRMDPSTDRLGRTILECVTCGPQMVDIIGEHKYDQFERHRDELAQLISRGKTQVSRKIAPSAGDAYRQVSHQKGLAGFLGEIA